MRRPIYLPKLFSIIILGVFYFLFNLKALAAVGDYVLTMQSRGFGGSLYNVATMIVKDYGEFPDSNYYFLIKTSDGKWYKQNPRVFFVNSPPINSVAEVVAIPNATEIYLYRTIPGEEDQFLTGVNYDFGAQSGNTPLFNEPVVLGSVQQYTLPSDMSAGLDIDGDGDLDGVLADEPPADDAGGPVPVPDYKDTIMKFTARISQFAIGFAIVVSVFLLPYMGILWGSGDPENIKKASEWFYSWLTGLIFLLMSGVIVRIIGSDILQFN